MKRKLFLISLILFFLALPLLLLFLQIFKVSWPYPKIVPELWSPRALIFLVKNFPGIARVTGNSFFFSMTTVFVTISMTLLPASYLGRNQFPGKHLLEALFLAPALIPSMIFAMGLHRSFIRTGLSDSIGGVVLVLSIVSYPYMLRALMSGYQAMGEKYLITAKNLGANALTSFFLIELPFLLPAMVAGGSVVFLVAFSEYFLVYFIGGGVVESLTGYVVPFMRTSDHQLSSILITAFIVVPLCLFLIVDRSLRFFYRRRGLHY